MNRAQRIAVGVGFGVWLLLVMFPYSGWSGKRTLLLFVGLEGYDVAHMVVESVIVCIATAALFFMLKTPAAKTRKPKLSASAPPVETVACPLCNKPIESSLINAGKNVCPSCNGSFDAEL